MLHRRKFLAPVLAALLVTAPLGIMTTPLRHRRRAADP